jgi:hypothetical protein
MRTNVCDRPRLKQLYVLLDMIYESSPVSNIFVSVPSDMGQLNCAAFLAGIIAGMLDSSKLVRISVNDFSLL